MNREMLKECIADAKTIRETAIANAKVALEEAFTPQLTAMFAERLNELELEEAETEKEPIDEMYGIEEDFNLEEILAELSMEEGDEEPMKEEGMYTEELDEDLDFEDMSDEALEKVVLQVIDDMIASGKLMPGEGEEEGEEGDEMEDMEDMDDEEIDEEINLEELLAEMDSMEEETSMKKGVFGIAKKIADKVSGVFKDKRYVKAQETFFSQPEVVKLMDELEQAKAAKDKEKEVEIQKKMTELILKFKSRAKEFDLQDDTADLAKTLTYAYTKYNVDPNLKGLAAIGSGVSSGNIALGEIDSTELEEAYAAIAELRNELNEINLLNAKLLYTNKIFKAKNLTESEKIKVLNTFDKAETVKEVKLVFETLTESFKATTAKKNPIKESLGSASKTISTATPKQPIIESNEAFARMQRLAGLKK
jgi:hypothetical protein